MFNDVDCIYLSLIILYPTNGRLMQIICLNTLIPLSPCNCQLTWICSLCTPFFFFSLFCVSCGRSVVYSPPKAVKIESSRILHRLKFLKSYFTSYVFNFVILCNQCRKTWLIKELNNSSAFFFYLKRKILPK